MQAKGSLNCTVRTLVIKNIHKKIGISKSSHIIFGISSQDQKNISKTITASKKHNEGQTVELDRQRRRKDLMGET